MNRLIFTSSQAAVLRADLQVAEPDLESAAVVLGSTVVTPDGERYVVQEVHMPPARAYRVRTPTRVELSPEFFVPLVRRARAPHRFVGFVHSHPFEEEPRFSRTDNDAERGLLSFLAQRTNSPRHVAMVMGSSGWRARQLGTDRPLRVASVGDAVRLLSNDHRAELSPAYDRQVRAFGTEGQSALQQLRIGVVGLGGTGSLIAQQLAHLGVRSLCLVDFDLVDAVNLSRMVGTTVADLGDSKVAAIARFLRTIQPECAIDATVGNVLDEDTARLLADCDLVFSCTDSHGSRAVLNQLAYQYYVPCIDMGVAIAVRRGQVTHVAGRVQMLSPGLGCLTCGNLLDAGEVRNDLLSESQRRQDPYIVGAVVPQPSVITINSTVASLAASMFLAATTDMPLHARLQVYDGLRGSVRPARIAPVERCVVCSVHGSLGQGDAWSLPTRKSSPPA